MNALPDVMPRPARGPVGDYGAGDIARGMGQVGGAVVGLAEHQQKSDDALDLIKAEAHRRPRIMELENEFDRDPDHATFDNRFKPRAKEIDDEAAALIRNPELRERFRYKAENETTVSRNRVLDKGTKLASEEKLVETDRSLNSLAAAYTKPSATDEDRAKVMAEMNAAIELGKRTGLLTPKHAYELEKRHINGNNGILYREGENRLWDDPYALLSDLNVATKLAPKEKSPAGATDALEFIKGKEGWEPRAKWDYAQYTNGYGTKARYPGEVISREEAQRRLEEEAGKVGDFLDQNVTRPLSPKQRTALISFGFNLGMDKGGLTDLVADVNAGNDEKVARRMLAYHNAGGKPNQGLMGRRRDESRLYMEGAREGATPAGVPDQGGNLSDENVPEGDRLPKLPEDVTPAAERYARMSPEARARLMTRARTALSDRLQTELKNTAAEVARTGEMPVDEQGKTALDRAARILTPNQLAKARRVVDEAKLGYQAVAPLSNMSDEDVFKHFETLAPKPGEQYAAQAKAQDRAMKDWGKIKELRDKDPVAAISGATIKGSGGPALSVDEGGNVIVKPGDDTNLKTRPAKEIEDAQRKIEEIKQRAAQGGGQNERFPQGPVTLNDAYQTLIDARIAAQQRLLPGQDYKHRIISRDEADRLLNMPKNMDVDSKEYMEGLKKAADRASKIFGPKYGERAFHEAIAYRLKKDEDIRAADRVYGKIVGTLATKGLTADSIASAKKDLEKAEALDQLDRWDNEFRGVMGGQPANTSTAPRAQFRMPDAPRAYPTPSEQETAWALHKPERQKKFDEQFGEGAYAKAVEAQKQKQK